MIGKEKCRILKEIRQKIADENDIAYVTCECTYQGDCKGTCPKCESELRYLEEQLAARAASGKRIAIAALCAGMTFSMSSCATAPNNKGKETVEELGGAAEPMPEPDEDVVLDGEVGPDHYDEDEPEGSVAGGPYTEDERDTYDSFDEGTSFKEGTEWDNEGASIKEGTEGDASDYDSFNNEGTEADSTGECAADEDTTESADVEEETK